jgi:hypothetical protein
VVLGRNPQGRGGCRWSPAVVRVRGAVGKLERSREGVGEEWGWEDESTRKRGASGSVTARPRGKRREKGGGPGHGGGVPRGAEVPWGLAPIDGRRPAAARARRSWTTCAARACRPDRAGREAPDGWATAQCRAAVSLIGGAGLSAGAEESAGARGPVREENG